MRAGDDDERVELEMLDRPHRLLRAGEPAPPPAGPETLLAEDEAARDLDRELDRHGAPHGRRPFRTPRDIYDRATRSRAGGSHGHRDEADIPDRCLHRRRVPSGRERQAVHHREPGDRTAARRGRRRRRRRHRPRGPSGASGVRRRPVVAPLPGRSEGRAAGLRGPARGQPRGAGDARLARGRQTHHRLPRRRRPGRDPHVPLVRRGDRQGLRRGRADRPGGARADRPRARRRRRCRRALELPAPDGDLEAGPGPGRRQQRDREAGRTDLAEHDPDGRDRRRGGHPRRRLQRRARARRDGRPGARPAHGRGHGHVHGLDRGRALLPQVRRREQPQGDHARMRRQEPAARPGKPAGPRLRRRAGPRRRADEHGRELLVRVAPDRRPVRPRRPASTGSSRVLGPGPSAIPWTRPRASGR